MRALSDYGPSCSAFKLKMRVKAIQYLAPPGEPYANDAEREAGQLIWFESGLKFAVITLTGYRYSIARLLPPDTSPPRSPHTVFISHGGPTMVHVDRVSDLLTAVGLFPVVVAKLPSMNLSLNQKVLR